MTLENLSIEEFGTWDAYVEAHPAGSIFHTTKWLTCLGENVQVIVTRKKSRIAGGMAFINTRRFGVTGIHNLPYTPLSGPLFGDLESESHFSSTTKYYEFIKAVLNEIRFAHVDLFLPEYYKNILPYKWSGFSEETNVTYQLSQEELMEVEKQLDSNKRREVAKFEPLINSGDLQIEFDLAVDEIIEMQELIGSRKNFDGQLGSLRKILENLKDNYFSVALSSKEFGRFSLGVFVFDSNCAYSIVNASKELDHEVYKHSNVFMLYQGMLETGKRKLTFDFEGSSIPGVERFYRSMGGRQVQRVRLQKSRSLYYFILRSIQKWKREKS